MTQQTFAHSTGRIAGRSRVSACPAPFAPAHSLADVTIMTYWGGTANANATGNKRPARHLAVRTT